MTERQVTGNSADSLLGANSDSLPAATIDLSFAHRWRAEILAARPLILPPRSFVYPRAAEEVEKGALEVLVHPEPGTGATTLPFLATCALGFRDPAVPTGIWATPEPEKICAVAGGYAYIVDTGAPERFTMIAYRPVMEVRAVAEAGVLLFIGHRSVVAWGREGLAWETERLSDEGLTVTGIEDGRLEGLGWQMLTDRETAFAVDLRDGKRVGWRVEKGNA